MKEFISYNEMKKILFPTDIQSETFVTADETIQDDLEVVEDLYNDNINCCNLQEKIDNIKNDTELSATYPLEDLYKEIDIKNREKEENFNTSANYAKVRILHAASSYKKLNVSIGSRKSTEKLPFGRVSKYVSILDGYRTVSVIDAETGVLIMYDVLPFVAGSKVTIVVFSTAAGMELSVISDNLCRNKLMGTSCFRAANYSFDDGPFDLLLNNMCSIFTDIRTKEVTSFKQAAEGEYNFYVIDTSYNLIPYNHPASLILDKPEIKRYILEEKKMIVPENILDISISMKMNISYTMFIIGGFYPEVPLEAVIVESE